MLPLLPILLLILSGLAAMGQTTVSGRVKDGKGHPLQGASISIKDTYDGAITDSMGLYHFRTTEKGEQTFLVTSIGFKLYEQKLNITGAAITLDVVLKQEP